MSIGDPFKDLVPGKGNREFKHESFKKAGHDIDFKLSRVVPALVPKKAAYEWIPAKPDPIKNRRDTEGNVLTENPNFYTTKLKKGKAGKGTSFGGLIPYVEEDPHFIKN